MTTPIRVMPEMEELAGPGEDCSRGKIASLPPSRPPSWSDMLPYDPSEKPPAGSMGAWYDGPCPVTHIKSNARADTDRANMGHEYLIGHDLSPTNGSKKIRSVMKMHNVFLLIRSTPEKFRNLYATSHPNEPTKLAFDLEYEHSKEKHQDVWKKITCSDDPPTPEEFLGEFLDDLNSFLVDRAHHLKSERVAVSQAHDGSVKISFHVVLLDFWIDGPNRGDFYGKKKDNKYSGVIPQDKHLGKWIPCLDISLGTPYRHFRTLHSTKMNQNRHLLKVTELAGRTFFDSEDDFETFLAHTWTYCPKNDEAVQIVVPMTGQKRASPETSTSATTPARSCKTARGLELFRLLGLHDKFRNITELEVDRTKFPSTLATFRARLLAGPCPWCSKADGHANNFFFPVQVKIGELCVSAHRSYADGTCPGCPKLPFDQEAYTKALHDFEKGVNSSAPSGLYNISIGDALRDARQAVRSAVVKMKLHDDPGEVWSTALPPEETTAGETA